MGTSKYTQYGTVSVIILLPLFVLFTGLSIRFGVKNNPVYFIHIFLAITFLICLLTFYKSTIIVTETHVSFKLGLGLYSKHYKIADIKSCHSVSNSVFRGIGVRVLPNGWLFTVTGLKAIELQFKNSTSVVRIGTNKPKEISELIQSMVGGGAPIAYSNKKQIKKRLVFFIILFILVIIGFVFIPNSADTRVKVSSNEFKIEGVYGLTISFADIEQIDTISTIPKISIRTNGYAFGKTLIGNFTLSDHSPVKLFVKKDQPPFLIIKSKDQVPVYINFKDKKKTIDLFNRLTNKK